MWNIKDSAKLYALNQWGKNFFSINKKGSLEVKLKHSNIDLYQLVQDLKLRDVQSPLLIRFPEILESRLALLNHCFNKAIKEYKYKGNYHYIYPIKVNQEKHLVRDIAKFSDQFSSGVECGSKPELLIALALDFHHNPIICNGFKDSAYIKTALLSLKLGKQIYIVIDRKEELDITLKLSKELNITPLIGLRVKLSSSSASRWDESSNKSKFGLNSTEIIESIDKLKKQNLLKSLKLIHFHMGSQVSSIFSIKSVLKEGTRFFTEIYKLGAKPDIIDVGGGLGIHYGCEDQKLGAMNYTEQEYANDVVFTIQSICDENKIPHPHIITESGRALTAHSSVLIFDILGTNSVESKQKLPVVSPKDAPLIKELFDIYTHVNLSNINEYFHDLMEKQKDINQLFNYGHLNLKQKSKAENIFLNSCKKIHKLTEGKATLKIIHNQLNDKLTSTYFGNFSLFQSIPDAWAIKQIFPIMPIHQLDKEPTQRAVIADLTCDSDGKINNFISQDSEKTAQTYLPVHSYAKNKTYYLGVFLIGAYQEILGDLHNLFGDTHAVHIESTKGSYEIKHLVHGNSISEVLKYVEYNEHSLIESIRKTCEQGLKNKTINHFEARQFMKNYQNMITSYTYLN